MTTTQFLLDGQLVRLPATLALDASGPTDPAAPALQDALPLDDVEPATIPDDAPRPCDALAGAAARQLVEVLTGRRSPHQASGWMGEDALAVALAWRRQRPWGRTRLVSVRPGACADGAVEAALHLADGDEHFAAAIRLEHASGRWVLAVLDVVLPPAALGRAA